MNPLGVRALYLGSSAYRIHGTDAPWTIGTSVSKGCIRLYNQDVLDLYPRVNVGTKVTVTYQTFTTSGAPAGAVSSLSDMGPKSVSTFLFGGDDPASPPRRPVHRAKLKGAASSKAAAQGSKAAHKPTPAEKSAPVEKPAAADKSAAAAVLETAAPSVPTQP
jgi:hypothetical protein